MIWNLLIISFYLILPLAPIRYVLQMCTICYVDIHNQYIFYCESYHSALQSFLIACLKLFCPEFSLARYFLLFSFPCIFPALCVLPSHYCVLSVTHSNSLLLSSTNHSQIRWHPDNYEALGHFVYKSSRKDPARASRGAFPSYVHLHILCPYYHAYCSVPEWPFALLNWE